METYAERSEAKKFWNLKNKHTFYFNNHSQIFSLCLNFSLCHKKIFSLCLKIFPCVKAKFPVFSLSGKIKNQIPCFPCFPCAVATLNFIFELDHEMKWKLFCEGKFNPRPGVPRFNMLSTERTHFSLEAWESFWSVYHVFITFVLFPQR